MNTAASAVPQRPSSLALLPLAIAAILATPQALAAGFAVPESSATGLALANALVANPKERGAIIYNPAAMAFHEQDSVALGMLLLNPHFSVSNAAGSTDSAGADWFVAPMFQAAVKINDKWSAGLGLSSPFGLETRWPLNTFPALTRTAALPPRVAPAGTRIPLSPQPTESKLEILDFTPTATYRVTENLALSAGVDFYWAKSAELNSSLTTLQGDGTGFGFNLSALFVQDAISIGVNFHSASAVGVSGSFAANNSLLVMLGGLPPSQAAKLELDLPWRLQVGVRYEFTPQIAAEFDYNRTGWSEFQDIVVRGDLGGAPLVNDTNDWDDANAFRLGLTWDVRENTQLRIGYTYDETGQPDQYFSARIPDNDRQLFSLGVGQKFAGGWQVDFGYMYVMFEQRDFTASRPYLGGSAINGTSALDGDYDAHAHLIALEVSKSFDMF